MAATAAPKAPNRPADPLALGEEIYQKRAADVGCQLCHGKDGKGGQAPDIRGKTAEDVRFQLQNNPQMGFIKLTQEEVEAVAAYLKTLAAGR